MPIHVLQYKHEVDSAEAGKFRSGLGLIYRVQYLADIDQGYYSGLSSKRKES